MAFVFKSERKDEVATKATIPGPGAYVAHNDYKIPKGYAPFLSTSTREKSVKKEELPPGPGAYNIRIDVGSAAQNQKILVSSLNPEPSEVEKPKLSTFFKSGTKRFKEPAQKEDIPGPGSYFQVQSLGKRYSNPNSVGGPSRYQMIEKAIKNTKFLSIPSIPSNVHSYGYSETDNHDLILNKNPLLEVQQFVGPGYYETKDAFSTAQGKGAAWCKSGAKRFTGFARKTQTTNTVGPGSYDLTSKPVPLYKLKPSPGFASTSGRAFGDKSRDIDSKSFKRTAASAGDGRVSVGALMAEEEDEDEYIDDATPGPGYYYNESVASSIKTSYKPVKLQFFGSGTERFKENLPGTNYVGPGEYNMPSDFNKKTKKNTKAPFQSSNIRFDKAKSQEKPGPGYYNPKVTIQDQIKDKTKKGYLGNFGTTDKRFKEPTSTLTIKSIPGPGAYYQENDHDKVEDLTEVVNKGSHFFKSGTKRAATYVKKDEIPAPGTYDVKYFDISTKVIKEEEDPELSPKKAPFNTTEARFKEVKQPEINEEDQLKPANSKNLDLLIKEKMKAKPSAAFASMSKRVPDNKAKEVIPGPGAYFDPANSSWNKRTFNILFTVD